MKSFLGPRSRRRIHAHAATAPTATTVQAVQAVVVVPARRLATSDAYTWGVNALVESGRTELAYELAAAYADEA